MTKMYLVSYRDSDHKPTTSLGQAERDYEKAIFYAKRELAQYHSKNRIPQEFREDTITLDEIEIDEALIDDEDAVSDMFCDRRSNIKGVGILSLWEEMMRAND